MTIDLYDKIYGSAYSKTPVSIETDKKVLDEVKEVIANYYRYSELSID